MATTELAIRIEHDGTPDDHQAAEQFAEDLEQNIRDRLDARYEGKAVPLNMTVSFNITDL